MADAALYQFPDLKKTTVLLVSIWVKKQNIASPPPLCTPPPKKKHKTQKTKTNPAKTMAQFLCFQIWQNEKCIFKPCLKAVLLFTILLVIVDADGFEICTQTNVKGSLFSCSKNIAKPIKCKNRNGLNNYRVNLGCVGK